MKRGNFHIQVDTPNSGEIKDLAAHTFGESTVPNSTTVIKPSVIEVASVHPDFTKFSFSSLNRVNEKFMPSDILYIYQDKDTPLPADNIGLLSKIGIVVNKVLHPFNLYARFKESREAFHALKELEGERHFQPGEDVKIAKDWILKKMFIALGVSEGAAYINSLVTPTIVQAVTGDPNLAIKVMAFTGYAVAITAYDAAWYMANRDYYKSQGDTFWSKAKSFVQDVLPVHLVAVPMAIPFTYAAVKLSEVVTGFLHTITNGLDAYIPTALYSVGIFTLCESLPFLLAMTLLINKLKMSDRIAGKYLKSIPD